MRNYKRFSIIIASIFIFAMYIQPINTHAETSIEYTEEEAAFISRTQNGEPIKMGILPHTFPLSDTPPNTQEYVGTNIEMLKLITSKTGLTFEYSRINLEEKSPYQSLLDHEFMLVAGTIKLENFLTNPNLVLSDRFDDGSLICISEKSTDPNVLNTGKIAVLKGYQAGEEYSKKQFPSHEIVYYDDNAQVVEAVRKGDADIAMISRYVGIYELQSPLNENLNVISPYQVEIDSCIMGLNTPDMRIAISIINKGLSQISENEYNHIQMNFSLTHPYNLSIVEYVYENRYFLLLGLCSLFIFIVLFRKLLSTQKDRSALSRDPLTSALTEAGFELAVTKLISKSNKPLFITDFDLSNFSTYNELHGKAQGDELLKSIAKIVGTFLSDQDIICRSYADNFKVISSKNSIEDVISEVKQANEIFNQMVDSKMIFNFGIYPIVDTSIPISKMLDFATIARKNAKHSSERFIDVFDETLYQQHMKEMQMIEYFDKAMANKEFVAYYQPKYDVKTKEIIGAEALVRWCTTTGKIIMPGQFIDLFEKNGLIQKLDFCMLENACVFLKKRIELGQKIIPISVNFSRIHMFSKDFVDNITELVERYEIPKHFIEVECTETAMTYDTELSKDILGQLRKKGFEIAMDDFGKGYSSLNALSTMPLDVIKLDSGFFSSTLEFDTNRANKVIIGVISLVHDLSLKIIAEGVETQEQFEFLKSIGCDFIQGYYFSKPLSEEDFLKELYQEL